LKKDPSTGNPSHYQNSCNSEILKFKEEFSNFLERGSQGFTLQIESHILVKEMFQKVITYIRDPKSKIPFSIPKSMWMDTA
jgi:hypothetical protein